MKYALLIFTVILLYFLFGLGVGYFIWGGA